MSFAEIAVIVGGLVFGYLIVSIVMRAIQDAPKGPDSKEESDRGEGES